MQKILVVDDHKGTTKAIQKIVEGNQQKPFIAFNAEDGFEIFKREQLDLVITDVKLPGMSGLELLRKIHEFNPETPVIVITAFGTIESAVDAMKLGAVDYIAKPFTLEEIELKIKKVLTGSKPAENNTDSLQKQTIASKGDFTEIVGQSEKLHAVFNVVQKVTAVNSPVLILGESGTGKELIARALHNYSPWKEQPFVKINCAALAEGVLESELFGHERGAFTGAIKTKLGRFEVAGKGTIFLDEICEISAAVQIKLLRVLQEKEFERVGGIQTLKMQARIVTATNQDIEALVKKGAFREDLFYRLNIVAVELPPLRERVEDIPALVQHFIRKTFQNLGKQVDAVSPAAMKHLLNYSWPGNIRELENVIERASVLSNSSTLGVEDLTPNVLEAMNASHALTAETVDGDVDYTKRMDEFEKQLIFSALMETRGNISAAAKRLNLKRTTLRYKMEKHDLLRFKFE